ITLLLVLLTSTATSASVRGDSHTSQGLPLAAPVSTRVIPSHSPPDSSQAALKKPWIYWRWLSTAANVPRRPQPAEYRPVSSTSARRSSLRSRISTLSGPWRHRPGTSFTLLTIFTSASGGSSSIASPLRPGVKTKRVDLKFISAGYGVTL